MIAPTRTATVPAGKPGYGATTIDIRIQRYTCDRCAATTGPLTAIDPLPPRWTCRRRGDAWRYTCPTCSAVAS